MASKKQGTPSLSLRAGSSLADSANDAVPGDEPVQVPQDLINGIDVRID